MKKFNIICAVSLNGVIGNTTTNNIPWHLPLDFKHFKNTTSGKTVIMGTNTFNSIGKPLPNRRNVVICRNLNFEVSDFLKAGVDEYYLNVQAAIQNEKEGFFIIGGERIYLEALNNTPSKLFITIVNHEFQGDVKFPITGKEFTQDVVIFNNNKYVCVSRSKMYQHNNIDFQFTEFDYVPE